MTKALHVELFSVNHTKYEKKFSKIHFKWSIKVILHWKDFVRKDTGYVVTRGADGWDIVLQPGSRAISSNQLLIEMNASDVFWK